MAALRDHLAAELSKKVNQRGVVVWQDTDREYSDVAASLCPSEARFAAYDGSWYALRHDVESFLAAESPPKLVVYAVGAPPSDDPLEEIRAAGVRFTLRLNTLVRNALQGQVSEQRLGEIGHQARTLVEAEAAIAGEGGDVRLISILGASDALTMVLRIVTGERGEALETEDAWPAAAELLGGQIGGSFAGAWDELREAALRQMVLTELAGAEGELPEGLRTAWGSVNAEQRRRTAEVLHTWRSLSAFREDYGGLAHRVDDDLGLRRVLSWSDRLEQCVATPAIENIVFDEAVHRLERGDFEDAADLSIHRLDISPWVQPYGPAGDGWAPLATRWRAVRATADLRLAIAASPAPASCGPGQLLGWYVGSGWVVDQAHRRFEIACNQLRVHGELEPAFADGRIDYEDWLDATLLAFTTAVERDGFDVSALARQGDIYARWVRDGAAPVAYVWVDALRYELGSDLAEGLRADGHETELHAAVAAVPTITPVGMANLTPDAGSGLVLRLADGDLSISVDGSKVEAVPDRIARLRAAHGDKVLDRTLDVVAGQGEKELKRALGDADLLLVRSQELDSAGESGMLNAAWSQFTTVLDLLRNLVARLGQAGVRRIVITADHGFVTLSRGLGPNRSIDPPTGGSGDLYRRGWVGKGAATTESTLRVPLSSTGVPSDLDLIAPRGLAVFRAGGAKQFFHGGLSPQELVVPVLVVDTEPAPAPTQFQVEVSIAGGRITTGVFAATIGFTGDLFTSEITVRVVAQGADGRDVVARVVSGDGYDPATGAVALRAETPPPILTFQVTTNLERDTTVEIEVIDARTGVRLGGAEALVAATIVVDEDL